MINLFLFADKNVEEYFKNYRLNLKNKNEVIK